MRDVIVKDQTPRGSKIKAFARRHLRAGVARAREEKQERERSLKAHRKWLAGLDHPYTEETGHTWAGDVDWKDYCERD